MPNLKHIASVLIVAALGTVAYVLLPGSGIAPVSVAAFVTDKPVLLPLSANVLSVMTASNSFGLIQPAERFTDRITKKTFGMHITPATSPVDHDRFAGFHTGVDAEFTHTSADIPIVAIADGVVVISKWATGYGGVVVVKHTRRDIPLYALYGHLDPASMVRAGTGITAGQQLGILGDDHSEETDNVRKHLHFSLYTGEKVDVRGYVPTEAELANWVNPLGYF